MDTPARIRDLLAALAHEAGRAALAGVGNNLLDQDARAAGDIARVIAGARRFLEPGLAST
jgi:hypothetical protein